jgi:uncharacterized protein (TIGR02118 family)
LFKLVFAVMFKDGEKEASFDHWINNHPPLILEIPGVVKYVQNEILEDLGGTTFDGISEIWFEDKAAYDAAMASEHWANVVQPDGNNFLNWEKTGAAVMKEHVLR